MSRADGVVRADRPEPRAVVQPTASPEARRLKVERWLADKLELGLRWDAGVTTQAQRRETIRAAVLERDLADTLCYRSKNSGPQSWRQAFARCYGQPLQTDEVDFTFTAEEGA
jgi:hypothetical protein